MTSSAYFPVSRDAVVPGPRRCFALCITSLMLVLLPSCELVDLTAPLESTISISANPLFIAAGSRSAITVVISRADGVPVADETVVTFTTTLGTIPLQADTRNGVANVELTSGGEKGVAFIVARSGTLESSVDVTIGAIVANIVVAATPASLGPDGGSSTITATVFGDDGEPLDDAPVAFSTDAGTLASGGAVLRSGPDGQVEDMLSTEQSATVTATAATVSGSGVVSASITVTVDVTENQPPQALLVASPTTVVVGETVNFSAAGSVDIDGSIVAFEWDFGDGTTAEGQQVTHRYESANTFTVLLVVTDDDGAKASATESVTVTAAAANLSDRH